MVYKPKIIAVVPARMASTRFPGKPLADILGLPMIEHVRRRVALSPVFDSVVVATCDQEIFDVVRRHGGKAVMTADTHERCTDRIAEATLTEKADIVVNVQGDEPLVRPEGFAALIEPLLKYPDLQTTNLIGEILTDADFKSPNVVKTVVDPHMNVLYFSREPIPSASKAGGVKYRRYRQLGIIAFRYDFLHIFYRLEPTPLEQVESVDMMRAIEHGYRVHAVLSGFQAIGVDVPADLEVARNMMKEDNLFGSY